MSYSYHEAFGIAGGVTARYRWRTGTASASIVGLRKKSGPWIFGPASGDDQVAESGRSFASQRLAAARAANHSASDGVRPHCCRQAGKAKHPRCGHNPQADDKVRPFLIFVERHQRARCDQNGDYARDESQGESASAMPARMFTTSSAGLLLSEVRFFNIVILLSRVSVRQCTALESRAGAAAGLFGPMPQSASWVRIWYGRGPLAGSIQSGGRVRSPEVRKHCPQSHSMRDAAGSSGWTEAGALRRALMRARPAAAMARPKGFGMARWGVEDDQWVHYCLQSCGYPGAYRAEPSLESLGTALQGQQSEFNLVQSRGT